MNTHGIDIFDEAYGDHLSGGISYNLELELFPADDRFLNKHLVNH